MIEDIFILSDENFTYDDQAVDDPSYDSLYRIQDSQIDWTGLRLSLYDFAFYPNWP